MRSEIEITSELQRLVGRYRIRELNDQEFIDAICRLSDDAKAELFSWVMKREKEREEKKAEAV